MSNKNIFEFTCDNGDSFYSIWKLFLFMQKALKNPSFYNTYTEPAKQIISA